MKRSHGHAPIAVQVTEAASLIGAPPSTLRLWCQTGILPARKIGKRWVIRLDELDGLTRTAPIENATKDTKDMLATA